MIAYIKTDDSFTAYIESRLYTIFPTDAEWDEAIECAQKAQWGDFIHLADRAEQVRAFSGGKLEVRDGAVYFQGKLLHNALTQRILRMKAEGFSIDPLIKFAENLYQNPSHASVEQLYTFLEANDQPITEDGCFMAYKRVDKNYMDVYSRTIRNSIGAVIKMDRNQVVDDPTQTCSSGLHVASLAYLRHYSGDRLLAVKVNPRDVVSVPTDYENSKMRVCQYEVVAELSMELIATNKPAWTKTVAQQPQLRKVWRIMFEAPDSTRMYWDSSGWTDDSPNAETYPTRQDALSALKAEGMSGDAIIEETEIYDES